ncbi:MAG: DNA repair protein RadC [Bacillota bacterium]
MSLYVILGVDIVVGEYRLTVKELPEDLRPRERLIKYGPSSLSSAELLAIILGTGNKRETALDVAARILHHCGGLRGLGNISIKDLGSFTGIGLAKCTQIMAAIELGSRIYKEETVIKPKIKCPSDVVNLVMDMQFLDREHFKVLYLSTKNHVIGIEEVSIGSLNSSIVHPREVFKGAIEKSAAAVILSHNHPSGDPEPSKEDIQVTRRLFEAGQLLGIEVLDHIIIGDGCFRSLKELAVI